MILMVLGLFAFLLVAGVMARAVEDDCTAHYMLSALIAQEARHGSV